MESILISIKKLLGISEEYDHFDPDIIMHINSVFMILTQMGVGPSEGFVIEDETSNWTEFITGTANIGAVKSYIYLKVRLLFDPPSSGAVMESINRQISELEWRLNVAADTIKSNQDNENSNGNSEEIIAEFCKQVNAILEPIVNGEGGSMK